jgi:hypothetical protein
VTAYRVDNINYDPRISADGTVPIVMTKKNGERTLWVNFEQPERAADLAAKIEKRGGIPQVTAVEVDASLLQQLRQKAVYDRSPDAGLNPNAPLYSDLPTPDQYGLRTSEHIQWFREAIDPTTVRIVDPSKLKTN